MYNQIETKNQKKQFLYLKKQAALALFTSQ